MLEEIEERRRSFPMPDDKWRDKDTEFKLQKVGQIICSEEGSPTPEIAVVPEEYVLQVSDGETEMATYKPYMHRLYTAPDITLYEFCHELAHHIEVVEQRVNGTIEKYVEEFRRDAGKPWDERGYEKRAEDFAMKCVFDYRDEWERIFGSKRFTPLQRSMNETT